MQSNQMDPPLPQEVRKLSALWHQHCYPASSQWIHPAKPLHHSILSMVCFCDAETTVTFTKSDAVILYKEQVVTGNTT